MGKYKWRCNDPQKGGNTWRSKNANSCPTCGSEDIEIIAGPPPVWPWILGLLLIVLMAFLWMNRCSIIPSMCDSDDDSYSLVVNKYDNYFELSTEPSAGYDKLNFYVVNQLTGRELYSENNKFYPCESGDFVIRWEKNNEMVITGDTIISDFTVKNAHQNACERKLSRDDVTVNLNDFCENTILLSNFGEKEVEVSVNKDSGYKRGKIIWTESEVGNATNFYVRLINNKSNVVSKKIKKCTSSDVDGGTDAPEELDQNEINALKSNVKNSFDLYMKDYKNNRLQFSTIFDETNSNPVVIYEDAEGNELFDFIMYVNAMEDTNFRLDVSDIEVNSIGKITKLNIKRK